VDGGRGGRGEWWGENGVPLWSRETVHGLSQSRLLNGFVPPILPQYHKIKGRRGLKKVHVQVVRGEGRRRFPLYVKEVRS